ncbi:MAG: hypothetical protein EKK59_10120 [Neisseriaceae bacterium]|nr:MAG: hypothetical protein EKK59_10120 [Neisseriaceae bacterium]
MSLQTISAADREAAMYAHLDQAMTAEQTYWEVHATGDYRRANMHSAIARENYAAAYAIDRSLRTQQH